MKYALQFILLLLSLTGIFMGLRLLSKARGSRLYFAASTAVITASVFSLINVVNIYFPVLQVVYIDFLLNALIIITTLNLWKVSYNQITAKTYSVLIYILILLQIANAYLVNNLTQVSTVLKVSNDYKIFYIISFIFLISKFYENRRLNSTPEMNLITIFLLLYLLSSVSSILVVGNTFLLFEIIKILSYIAIIFVYWKDYKRSFYY